MPLSQRPLRLLAVGATGRLGALLVPAWRQAEFGLSAGVELVVQARAEGRGADVLFDPLSEPESFERAARAADVVLGLAGVTPATGADMALNVDLARAACRAGEAAGKPVILASSAAVYGRPRAEAPLSETDPAEPLSDYGKAKLEMEAMAGDFARCCSVRIGNVAGADALWGTPAPDGGRVLDMFGPDAKGRCHAPARSYIGPVGLAQALLRLARFMAAGASVPKLLNLAEADVVGMDALLDAAGERYEARAAGAGAIARVELDVSRAIGLGLVPERPVSAQRLWHELSALRGANGLQEERL